MELTRGARDAKQARVAMLRVDAAFEDMADHPRCSARSVAQPISRLRVPLGVLHGDFGSASCLRAVPALCIERGVWHSLVGMEAFHRVRASGGPPPSCFFTQLVGHRVVNAHRARRGSRFFVHPRLLPSLDIGPPARAAAPGDPGVGSRIAEPGKLSGTVRLI